jgi:hypothetical protein
MVFFQLCKLIALHLILTALAGFDSILTRQHDHPVLAIPAGVQRDFTQGKVCVGDRLPGMLF